MKKLTCRDLAGPCNQEITGNSFEEISQNCKEHVMGEIQKGDEAHKAAAGKWKDMPPEEQQKMFAEFRRKYDESPEV